MTEASLQEISIKFSNLKTNYEYIVYSISKMDFKKI